MLCAVTALVPATITAAAIKVSSSFLSAHSSLVRQHEQRWLCVAVIRDMSINTIDGNGHTDPH